MHKLAKPNSKINWYLTVSEAASQGEKIANKSRKHLRDTHLGSIANYFTGPGKFGGNP